jgi:hypothetical protein
MALTDLNTTIFQFILSINLSPIHVNPLIHNRQQSIAVLLVTNLMQLIIRQDPNLCITRRLLLPYNKRNLLIVSLVITNQFLISIRFVQPPPQKKKNYIN